MPLNPIYEGTKCKAKCDECGLFRFAGTEGSVDPCIGHLPGVEYACCGHGENHGYLSFDNGLIIDFDVLKVLQRRAAGEPGGVWRTIYEKD